jgi:hypothetical protein
VAEPNGGRQGSEIFRWLTPIMLTVAIAILTSMSNTVNKIDDKMFKHLTNDEIHAPRSTYVQKTEFDLYQKFRNEQMTQINSSICDLKNVILERVKK